jgi:hypothetical protein
MKYWITLKKRKYLDKVKLLEHLAMTDDRRNGAVGVVTRLRLSRQRKCALIPVEATDFSSKISDWFWESCLLLMNL